MNSKSLDLLIYNPLWLKELIHYFLSGVSQSESKKLRFELVYFALPILYDEEMLGKLSRANVTSTLDSLSEKIEIKTKLSLQINKSVQFKKKTNKAIILLGNGNVNVEKGFISVSNPLHYTKATLPLKKHYKAAFNLGHIMAKESYREVFMKLGVDS